MILRSFSLLMIYFSFSTAQAAECLSATTAKTVTSAVKIELENSGRMELCRAESQSYRILQALILMKTLRFEGGPGSRGALDQGILKDDFWAYFSKRVRRVFAVGRPVSECRGATLAYVSPDFDSSTVFLCPGFFDVGFSVATRVEFLMHEARHFEGHSHVVCRDGVFRQQKNCDRRIQDRGSYAVSVEALMKMADRGSGLSAPSRALLRATALVRAKTNFNEPVLP